MSPGSPGKAHKVGKPSPSWGWEGEQSAQLATNHKKFVSKGFKASKG